RARQPRGSRGPLGLLWRLQRSPLITPPTRLWLRVVIKVIGVLVAAFMMAAFAFTSRHADLPRYTALPSLPIDLYQNWDLFLGTFGVCLVIATVAAVLFHVAACRILLRSRERMPSRRLEK